MRRIWRATVVASLMVTAAAGTSRGQVPGGAVGGAAGAAPAAGAAVGATGERVGFAKRLCQALDECRRKLCKSPAGKLLNGMTAPLTTMTGGVIPPFCPLMPSAKDLEKPGVAGAAAAAQKEALEAKERRDAVRFLGTLDCRYFPDAAVKLATALRADSSECVRYEAALVLNRGCCCTELTVKALMASVAGTDEDGNPAERSVRVRCAAALALEKCLSCYQMPAEESTGTGTGGGEKPPPKMGESTPGTGDKSKNESEEQSTKPTLSPAQRMPSKATVEKAWKILNEFNAMLAAYEPVLAAQPPGLMNERRSVYHLIKDSAVSPESGVVTASATVPAASKIPTAPKATTTQSVGLVSKVVNATEKKPTGEPTHAPKLLPASTTANKPTTTVMPSAPTAPQAPVAPAVPAATTTPVSAAPTAPGQPAAAMDPVNQQINRIAKQCLQGATPAERHAAIRELVKYDWKQHPMVAAALLAGAKSDAVDVVRVDCLRHIAAYKITHPQVLAELAAMINDTDPWVRQEAAAALSQLKGN